MVLENTAAAAFIGASVTLVLVIIFMVLMVILVRQCLQFMAKRNQLREQVEEHRRQRHELERRRRLSVTEPVRPTYDWHHSIKIEGSPPPSYRDAKKLPSLSSDDITPSDTSDIKEKTNVIHTGAEDSDDDFHVNVDAVSIHSDEPQPDTTENGNEDANMDNRLTSSSNPQVAVAVDEGGEQTITTDQSPHST